MNPELLTLSMDICSSIDIEWLEDRREKLCIRNLLTLMAILRSDDAAYHMRGYRIKALSP